MDFYFERKIDKLGRIVIPKDIRRIFEISENTCLCLSIENGKIVITKKEDKK